ncbi:MAG: nucleotide exchange factor GrpE [Chloroflexota bacterium]|nr:nucleotide exchange factor GrpE [Chloroflexota bacterium]
MSEDNKEEVTNTDPECVEGPSPAELTVEDVLNDYSHLGLDQQVQSLLNDLYSARKEGEANKDMAQRAQAELSNFRRRTDDDRITWQQQSNSRLLVKMLPVIDELELAVSHADDGQATESWVEGVRLIQRKVSTLLESEGVAKIEAVGVQFNPVEHEAIGTEESSEFSPGEIIQVVRNGYKLHDRIIQAAQVVVAR